MRHGPPQPEIDAWISMPLGVVTLAERHGGVTVSREQFEAMIAEVAVHVDRFAAQNGDIDGVHLLGTSGTVTTIAGVYLDLVRYERRRVDGCWLSISQITDVVERLLAMSSTTIASPIPASALNGRTLCWPDAPSSRRSAARFRASVSGSPIAGCARACSFR